MGAADHTAGNVHSATGTAGAHLSDAGAAIGDAPAQVKTKTQGNPLAAGLIAFGAGLLVSSLIPASQGDIPIAALAAAPVALTLIYGLSRVLMALLTQWRDAVEDPDRPSVSPHNQVVILDHQVTD